MQTVRSTSRPGAEIDDSTRSRIEVGGGSGA